MSSKKKPIESTRCDLPKETDLVSLSVGEQAVITCLGGCCATFAIRVTHQLRPVKPAPITCCPFCRSEFYESR